MIQGQDRDPEKRKAYLREYQGNKHLKERRAKEGLYSLEAVKAVENLRELLESVILELQNMPESKNEQ